MTIVLMAESGGAGTHQQCRTSNSNVKRQLPLKIALKICSTLSPNRFNHQSHEPPFMARRANSRHAVCGFFRL
jgi:hypothetical protein